MRSAQTSPSKRGPFGYVGTALRLALLLYGTFCLAVGFFPSLIGVMLEPLPRWLAPLVATVAGPALLLVDGAISMFAGAVGVSIVCGVISWLCWRMRPQSEWFVVPLLAALGAWVASGWAVVAAAW